MIRRGFPALAASLLLLIGCGGSDDEGSDPAHVNERSGSTNGAILDQRVGTAPAPGKRLQPREAAEAAGCYLERRVPPENDEKIPVSAPAPKYPHDPPLSGPYVAAPHQQADGAYLTMPDNPATVASLNHGRMAIQYAPDLSEEIQLQLKGLYDTMYGGTLFFRNETMNFAVAATTWTNGLYCTGWEGDATLEAIRAFGKATWGKYGAVPVDEFPVEGPTPADPEVPTEANGE